MKSLNDPLEIVFVVLNFMTLFRIPNMDDVILNYINNGTVNFRIKAPEKNRYKYEVIVMRLWRNNRTALRN